MSLGSTFWDFMEKRTVSGQGAFIRWTNMAPSLFEITLLFFGTGRYSVRPIDVCSEWPVVYKAPAFLRKDLISKTQLVLAKRRVYVSLAGSMLYQGACLGFVTAVLSPNFFLLPLFWEGPATPHQIPSFLLEAGSCCARPCGEILPWYEYNGSSSRHLLRGVVPVQGQAKRYSLHLPVPTSASRHRPSHWPPPRRPPPSLLKGLPLESGGRARKVRGRVIICSFCSRTDGSSRPGWRTEVLPQGKSPETQRTWAEKPPQALPN